MSKIMNVVGVCAALIAIPLVFCQENVRPKGTELSLGPAWLLMGSDRLLFGLDVTDSKHVEAGLVLAEH